MKKVLFFVTFPIVFPIVLIAGVIGLLSIFGDNLCETIMVIAYDFKSWCLNSESYYVDSLTDRIKSIWF
jgi:hypothetical protein